MRHSRHTRASRRARAGARDRSAGRRIAETEIARDTSNQLNDSSPSIVVSHHASARVNDVQQLAQRGAGRTYQRP